MVIESSNQAVTDHQQLNALYQRIQVATSLAALMPEVESDLLAFLQAECITVYQWEPNGRGIASRYKSGDELVEIKVPLTTRSIAGFVALCQQVLRIADVYDEQELTALHPQLRFNPSYDKRTAFRSRSMIVIPIKPDDIVLGVLQVINAQHGGAFTEADQTRLSELLTWLKMLSRLDLAETRKPQTGNAKLDIQGVAVEMRITILPVVQGEGAVLRLVASGGNALLLNQLSLSSAHLHAKEFSQLVTAYGEEYFGELTVDLEQLQRYRAVGCEHCGGTGYRGRTGIYELLICTEPLSQMIYRRASLDELRQQAIEDGMRTLMQDGVRKVLNGQSDVMQLLKVVGLSVGD